MVPEAWPAKKGWTLARVRALWCASLSTFSASEPCCVRSIMHDTRVFGDTFLREPIASTVEGTLPVNPRAQTYTL